jgi:hypothetical protein
MGKIWDALKRMVTLPARYNSVSDVAADPEGALEMLSQTLRSLRFWAGVAGRDEVYDALTTAERAVNLAKEMLNKR